MYTYPKLKKHDGLFGNIPIRFGDIYMGIEVEAEYAENLVTNPSSSWKVVHDGSLKRDGLEFVTHPIELKYMEMELIRLFESMNGTYTNRTSIHVHMNARDFTYEELARFLLLYMVYEKCLYKYSGDRYLNEYCIPICEATESLVSNINNIKQGYPLAGWCKYYGLNLRPLYSEERFGGEAHPKIGTVEFRQLEGTNNIRRIIDWCNLITCLKLYAKHTDTQCIIQDIIQRRMNQKDTLKSIFRTWKDLLPIKTKRKDISFGTDKAKFLIAKTKLVDHKFIEKPKPQPYLDANMVTLNEQFVHTDEITTPNIPEHKIAEEHGYAAVQRNIRGEIQTLGEVHVGVLDKWCVLTGNHNLYDIIAVAAKEIEQEYRIPIRPRAITRDDWAAVATTNEYIFTNATGTTATGTTTF
jgi:hypothetical protein